MGKIRTFYLRARFLGPNRVSEGPIVFEKRPKIVPSVSTYSINTGSTKANARQGGHPLTFARGRISNMSLSARPSDDREKTIAELRAMAGNPEVFDEWMKKKPVHITRPTGLSNILLKLAFMQSNALHPERVTEEKELRDKRVVNWKFYTGKYREAMKEFFATMVEDIKAQTGKKELKIAEIGFGDLYYLMDLFSELGHKVTAIEASSKQLERLKMSRPEGVGLGMIEPMHPDDVSETFDLLVLNEPDPKFADSYSALIDRISHTGSFMLAQTERTSTITHRNLRTANLWDYIFVVFSLQDFDTNKDGFYLIPSKYGEGTGLRYYKKNDPVDKLRKAFANPPEFETAPRKEEMDILEQGALGDIGDIYKHAERLRSIMNNDLVNMWVVETAAKRYKELTRRFISGSDGAVMERQELAKLLEYIKTNSDRFKPEKTRILELINDMLLRLVPRTVSGAEPEWNGALFDKIVKPGEILKVEGTVIREEKYYVVLAASADAPEERILYLTNDVPTGGTLKYEAFLNFSLENGTLKFLMEETSPALKDRGVNTTLRSMAWRQSGSPEKIEILGIVDSSAVHGKLKNRFAEKGDLIELTNDKYFSGYFESLTGRTIKKIYAERSVDELSGKIEYDMFVELEPAADIRYLRSGIDLFEAAENGAQLFERGLKWLRGLNGRGSGNRPVERGMGGAGAVPQTGKRAPRLTDIDKVIIKNEPFIQQEANKFRFYANYCGCPFDDVLQEARLAFFKALTVIDPNLKDEHLYKYAKRVIRNAMIDFFRQHDLPRTFFLKQQALKLYRLKQNNKDAFDIAIMKAQRSVVEYLNMITSEDQALSLEMELKTTQDALRPTYLDDFPGEENRGPHELIGSDPTRLPSNESDIFTAVKEHLSSLNESQRRVLTLKYLGPGLTQEEIGKTLGITGPGVSRIEKKTLEILRRRLAERFTEEVQTRIKDKKGNYSTGEKIALLQSLGVPPQIIKALEPKLTSANTIGYKTLKRLVPVLLKKGMAHLIPFIEHRHVGYTMDRFLRSMRRRVANVDQAEPAPADKDISNDEAIQRDFRSIFPDFIYLRPIERNDKRIIGASDKRVVYYLGEYTDENGNPLHLAVKMRYWTKLSLSNKLAIILEKNGIGPDQIGDDYTESHLFPFTETSVFDEREVRVFDIVKELGLPSLRYYKVYYGTERRNCSVMLVEDRSKGGKVPIYEYFGFDRSKVSNAQELDREFEGYYNKLIGAGVQPDGVHHGHTIDRVPLSLREEIEKSFFVEVDPETKKGRLFFGDGDQIEFN